MEQRQQQSPQYHHRENDHQYEIMQQGPDLQDSPRSERGGAATIDEAGMDSQPPRTTFYNLATESSSSYSGGEIRVNSSPSISKRAPIAQAEKELLDEDHQHQQTSPRRASQPPRSTIVVHPNDPRSQYFQQPFSPYMASAATAIAGPTASPIYQPVMEQQQQQQRGMNEAPTYYYPTSSDQLVGPSPYHHQQPPMLYHGTAMYTSPHPHYFYASTTSAHHPHHAHHAPPPSYHLMGTTGPPPPPGTWIYATPAPHPSHQAPPALFSPPAHSASTGHAHFAAFAPPQHQQQPPPLMHHPQQQHQLLQMQRSMQDSGTLTDNYSEEEAIQQVVKFRRQSPNDSPTRSADVRRYSPPPPPSDEYHPHHHQQQQQRRPYSPPPPQPAATRSPVLQRAAMMRTNDYEEPRLYNVVDYGRTDSYESGKGNNENETSPRHSYASTSSSATNRYHTGAKLEKEHGRTPLFGERPAWWGQEDEEGDEEHDHDEHSYMASVRSEIEHPRLSAMRMGLQPPPLSQRGRMLECVSDTEASTPFKRTSAYQSMISTPNSSSAVGGGSDQPSSPQGRLRSSIRMEVSLNDLNTPPAEDDPPERDMEKARRSECAATAFTIEFSNENEPTRMASLDKAQAAERNWKTQSAERMHRNFVRRSLRKEGLTTNSTTTKPQSATASGGKPVAAGVPEKPKTAPSSSSSSTSGKTYLLEKMLSSAAAAKTKMTTSDTGAESTPIESPATSTETAHRVSFAIAAEIESPVNTPLSNSNDNSKTMINRRESDVCSDAGTYVVEKDEEELMEARLRIDQVFGVVGDIPEDWQEEQAALANRTPSPASPPPNMEAVITSHYRQRSTSRGRSSASAAPIPTAVNKPSSEDEEDKKRKGGLLKQLIKNNTTTNVSTPTGGGSKSASAIRSKPPASASPSSSPALPRPPPSAPPTRETAAFQARRAAALHKRASFGVTSASSAASAAPGSVLARSEAGRYSMRSSSVSGGSQRVGGTTTASSTVASKALVNKPTSTSPSTAPKNLHHTAAAAVVKENENMKNWLRRKEYNPMKAAADAKKKATSATGHRQSDEAPRKANEEPVYLSNRSQSFHLGTVLAEASSPTSSAGGGASPLKKHPSLHDARRINYDQDEDDEEEDNGDDEEYEANVVSDSAAVRSNRGNSHFGEDSLERLASISRELGQRAKHVATKVRAGRSSDALHEMLEMSRNSEKEAALAALLNQLRVASQALEEVDRIFPDEEHQQQRAANESSSSPSSSAASRRSTTQGGKLKRARADFENSDV